MASDSVGMGVEVSCRDLSSHWLLNVVSFRRPTSYFEAFES
jgi:hypothetical protein